MSKPVRSLPARVFVVLLALGVLAGCASVPDSSPVQPLQQITPGEDAATTPGPSQTSDPVELVRGFISASAVSENRHAAARLFLTHKAQNWDDSAALTVLGDKPNVSYSQNPDETGHAVVRVQGSQIGRLNPDGSFVQDESSINLEMQVTKVDGQWRIATPPVGAYVVLQAFRANYKAVKIYFTDPIRHKVAPDLRYLAAEPARSMASRVMEKLLGGPSAALAGAVINVIPKTARLRSNLVPGPDGLASIDLTELGDLDDDLRTAIAAQVVFSLASAQVKRVHLTDDGAPLDVDGEDLTTNTLSDLSSEGDSRADVPGLVVINGRARMMNGNDLGDPLAGPAGNGGYDLLGATMSTDGQRMAAINRRDGRQLLIGREGAPLAPSGVRASSLTRPTWTPTGGEVWTVRDASNVARVIVGQDGRPSIGPIDASALTNLGPINDLRLSRDGVRVAAIVGGQLVVGAVSRSAAGVVTIRNVHVVRPIGLTDLVAVDWRSDDELAVVGRHTVARVSVDGLDLRPVQTNNLTLPLAAVADSPGRPLLVTDLNGLWSFGPDEVGTWRQLASGAATVPGYPG
ncbi:LpqB family beta-propeller domain-containing protein [Pseudonocardia spinosispora]|uniref:LpqB family beta-propeller domain-containing protein n=1 Tax=Pseudonocardia spinosispora TaxID=103441 RepID=UPI000402FE8A|nr:LpqB family beta-propeller domain-containing protein [Pseudonocardia spinosispora]